MTTIEKPEHIHFSGDGEGEKRITVNGAEVKNCGFADTMLGIAVGIHVPEGEGMAFCLESERPTCVTYHGRVEIEVIGDNQEL